MGVASARKIRKSFTIDDVYALPEGQRAELIDGDLYMMASLGRTHQELVKEFTYLIESYIRRKGGECKVYPAPFAVFLNEDDKTYLEPDISVICDKNKLTKEGCMGAPDWIIEIVSSGSRQMDYSRKLFKYHAAGVREYWIVDKAKDQILVYNFEQDMFDEFTFSDKVAAGICDGLEIDFSIMELE